ncbi:MAG TPA: thioredoxin domain-containing protein [Anaerolineae bacterium]|nr:thioredoxin domain-containing protein [Anaerolineae bacterium]HID83538.1 hypothetical protein [Anaerolineales bacterium]HIQ09239.1 hypothetical protein [Anaerolineaceae bacterium]
MRAYAWLIMLILLAACAQAPATASMPSVAPPQATSSLVTAAPGTIACTSVRQPAPTLQGTPPYLRPDDHSEGLADAPVVLVMYGDYQDPSSAAMNALLARLRQAYPEAVRRVFRPLPLINQYDKALLAAQAAEAAARQGAFWPFHDRLLAEQAQWRNLSEADFHAYRQGLARQVGLDVARFAQDLDAPDLQVALLAAREEAQRIGLPGVPLLYLNGEFYPGPWDWNSLSTLVRLQALSARQFSQCPPRLSNLTAPRFAALHTEAGDIVLQLYPDQAPMAVSSFVFLARQGWYNENTFFEVRPGLWARTGDPSETGLGHPGYTFVREIAPDLTFDRPGRVGLYNDGPPNNGSQFFITLTAAPQFNARYTLFGQVIKGLDLLKTLPPRTPGEPDAPPGLRIRSVDVTDP